MFFFADVLNVHLVDVVSGGIVTTITHRRIKGPVNIVHSENWLVYSYYNDKVRRTELSKSNPNKKNQNPKRKETFPLLPFLWKNSQKTIFWKILK